MTPMHVNNLGGGQEGYAPISFLMTGEISHSGYLNLVEAWNLWWKWCIQIENSLRNYVNFTLGNRFSWVFKTLKPISFRGLRPLDPQCHDGISDENSTNRQFSAKLYVNSAPILPFKMGFLGL